MTSTSTQHRAAVAAATSLTGDAVGRRSRWRLVRTRVWSTLRIVVPPVALVGAFVAVWQLYATYGGVDDQVLPTPTEVASVGWGDRGALWAAMLPTLRESLIGLGLALVVAFVIACACDMIAGLRRAAEPVLVISQTIPIVALAPLFLIWFGFGLLPKVLLVALFTFFPLTVSLIQGLASTDAEATRLFRSLGASPLRRLWYLRLPSALPMFFSGLRISATFAVTAAFFAEYVGSDKGLAVYMLFAQNARQAQLVMAAILIISVLSIALYSIAALIEYYALPWRRVHGASSER